MGVVRGGTPTDTETRFRTAFRAAKSGCWEWGRALTGGRGYFCVKDPDGVWRRRQAARVAWDLWRREPRGDLWVLHSCDNGACVNPKHLFLGTARDNMHDMIAKGRQRWKEPSLSDTQAIDVVRLYYAGQGTQVELARRFGFRSHRSIGRLVRGESYEHLDPARRLHAMGTAGTAVKGRKK